MAEVLKIKEIVKSHKSIEKVARLTVRPWFWFCKLRAYFNAWLRSHGMFPSSKYEYLRNLKNTHIGERCFIVATGPSLTFDDLNYIKDEFSFGMNSCVLALDKTDWIPNILGIEDEYVYQRVERELLNASSSKLKGRVMLSNVVEQYFDSAKQFNIFPVNLLDHKYIHEKTGEIKFSDDCYCIIYDAYSIIFSLMQLAVYMGFKELYLLGSDCNYDQKNTHFIDHGAVDPFAAHVGSRLIYIHSKFKEWANARGVEVYNCTRGGMLEVYPRKSLEEVLNLTR